MSKESFKQESFFSEQDLIDMSPAPKDFGAKQGDMKQKEEKIEGDESGDEIVEPEIPDWLQGRGINVRPALVGSQRGAPSED